MDPFWEVNRPQLQQPQPDNEPGPSSKQLHHTPMEEGEIDSETDQDPSVLEVPADIWTKYVGVKSFQYIEMGHAAKVNAEEPNDWDLGNAVRETAKQFSTDLQLLMTESTNDPSLLKTLVCIERKQHENMPDEHSIYGKKLSTRYGLIFYENNLPEEPEDNSYQLLA